MTVSHDATGFRILLAAAAMGIVRALRALPIKLYRDTPGRLAVIDATEVQDPPFAAKVHAQLIVHFDESPALDLLALALGEVEGGEVYVQSDQLPHAWKRKSQLSRSGRFEAAVQLHLGNMPGSSRCGGATSTTHKRGARSVNLFCGTPSTRSDSLTYGRSSIQEWRISG